MKRKKHNNDLTIDQRYALMQVKIRDATLKHGAFIMCVFPTEDSPGVSFAYSIGIPTTFPGTSELIVLGLNLDNAAQIINNIVQLMREGQTFEAGKSYDGILKGLPMFFGEVELEHYENYVGQAIVYHKKFFPLLQVVWPDTHGTFPWEEGFEEKFRDKQPLLFEKS
jgi:hypothetical protein